MLITVAREIRFQTLLYSNDSFLHTSELASRIQLLNPGQLAHVFVISKYHLLG